MDISERSYSAQNQFTLQLAAWTNIPEVNNNRMDDYDWDVPGQFAPSRHSWHPDTHLSYAYGWDLKLAGWVVNSSRYGLALLAGYARHVIDLQARGGCYSYWNGTDTGCFNEGAPGGSYHQNHQMPYLGVLIGMRLSLNTL